MHDAVRTYNSTALALKLAGVRPGEFPYTLLLGAGASVSSGIDSARTMVATWKKRVYQLLTDSIAEPSGPEFRAWMDAAESDPDSPQPTAVPTSVEPYHKWFARHFSPGTSDYAALFGHFCQQPKERQMCIEQLLDRKKPSVGYYYLSCLIRNGFFNRVVTTNFDDLVADALVRFHDERPIVCAFDSAVGGVRVASLRPKLIKLHGDFLYDNIKNVRHEISRLDTNMEEKLYEVCKDAGLIVMGYSGGDESVMAPIRDMIRKSNHLNMGLHWCVQKRLPGKQLMLSRGVRALWESHPDRVHIYEIENFDALMLQMFEACKCPHSDILLNPRKRSPAGDIRAATYTYSDWNNATVLEHLRLFSERDRARDIDRDSLVTDAHDAFRAGSKQLAAGCLQEAELSAREAERLVDQYFADGRDGTSVMVWLDAKKRHTGVHVLWAEIDGLQGRDSCFSRLGRVLSVADEGVEEAARPEAFEVPQTLKRGFSYNAICAFGLKRKFGRELTDNDLERLRFHFERLRSLDPDASDQRDLLGESCYPWLRGLLDDGPKRPPGRNGDE